MAIDRIGKGGALPGAPEAGAPTGADKTGAQAPFKVERPEQSAAADPARRTEGAEGAAATSPLARLRAGEVDVNGYVDLQVEEATKSLKGLPPAELADIKSVLRDQLRTDPGLADLVRTATGKMPSPPED
jgi:hypothetical protein